MQSSSVWNLFRSVLSHDRAAMTEQGRWIAVIPMRAPPRLCHAELTKSLLPCLPRSSGAFFLPGPVVFDEHDTESDSALSLRPTATHQL